MKKKTVSIIIILIMLISCGIAFADGIVVAFEKREYKILAGKTEIIRPIIQGTTLTGKYVYSSSDETVATVNNGQVKGISPGDATINCTVTIGSDEFSCSYVIHVLQPVTKIEVPVKSMVLPAGAILNELPFIVLPENAANKEIDIISNNSKIELSSDGYFRVPNIKGGTYTYTFKTTDGSNVTAQFSVTVPKGAWFSVDNNIIIDDPAGIDLFYVITDDHTTNVLIHTSESYSTNGIVRVGSSKKDITELLEGRPFSFRTQDMSMIEAPRIVHFEPLKVGKGQFVVKSNNDKAMLNITVTRSAVYESIQYDQYQKNEVYNKSLRFLVSGTISSVEKPLFGMFSSGEDTKSVCIYMFCDGDEAKPACVQIPNTKDISSLITGKITFGDLDISSLKIGDNLTVKGIFIGMIDYVTETGLTKSIPCFTAEIIEQEESNQG